LRNAGKVVEIGLLEAAQEDADVVTREDGGARLVSASLS